MTEALAVRRQRTQQLYRQVQPPPTPRPQRAQPRRQVGHSTRDTFQAAPVGQYTHQQRLGAVRQLADVARRNGLPPELLVGTALVESRINNPRGGDRDSVGMFQQRAAWASRADRMDPRRSAELFANGVPGRGIPGARSFQQRFGNGPYTDRQLGQWAQAVQRSAFPDRYQQQMPAARALLRQAGVPGY